MECNTITANSYFKALSRADFLTMGKLFSSDIIWHQPGNSAISGVIHGKKALFAHWANLKKAGSKNYKLTELKSVSSNGDMVACGIEICAVLGKKHVVLEGMYLMKFDSSKIIELWIFSEDQRCEDEFWDAACSDGLRTTTIGRTDLLSI